MSQVKSKAKDDDDTDDSSSPPPQPLTDQQIQYLVDQAENAARQNQKRTLNHLSNEDVW